MKIKLTFLLLFILSFSLFSQNLKSPSDFLGYELGSQFTRHAQVVAYFDHIAKNSPMVNYKEYGRTNERRALTYAVISSEENLKNIESIRSRHLKDITSNEKTGSDIAIVWLSYNVHGNEASSTEAAMKTIYTLVTEKEEYLDNTVIIIDPSINPDGRDRYANWYNQVKTTPYNPSQDAAEHHEPWPGGRPNHYLFDLNRDWAWATQIETRERLKIYNMWLPHIHADFHEQGIDDPYYFAPAAEPFHEIITPFQREFQTRIGKNHAKYFDENGWLYFTGERFDLLYPSYGDTYPTYMGAIGMTYEQAGHGRAGLGIHTNEGNELTLKDRIEHHFTTGISTVDVASKNASEINEEFKKYFKAGDYKYKSYVLNGDHDKINALTKLLDQHEIKYSFGNIGNVNGYSYKTGKKAALKTNDNSLVISTEQPKGKMVKVLFEPQTNLADSLTYDITAWSLPYAYGLDAIASSKILAANNQAISPFEINKISGNATGYISKWNSINDAQFFSELLKQDIKVRFTEIPFENKGEKFERGSLIISKSDNSGYTDFNKKVAEIANKFGRKLLPAETGFAGKGPDFGSPDVKIINPQKIAVLKGEGVSSLNFGEIWYFFEQELKYPITPINTDYFKTVALENFNVLIIPSGNYEEFLDQNTIEKIKSWVTKGGKLIAIGKAVSAFSEQKEFGLTANKIEKDTTAIAPKLIPYGNRERENIKNLITGSIIKTEVDKTHPLAFGYDDTYFTLKLSSDSFSLLDSGYNVAYIRQPQVMSGFTGSEALKNLKNSLVFGEYPMGAGSIIYMVDNPLFRAFWENGKLFFVNAVFLTNNIGYDN